MEVCGAVPWFPTHGSTHSLSRLRSLAREPSSAHLAGRADSKMPSGNGTSNVLASKDIGFASVTFSKLDVWPGLEIRITGRDVPIDDKGMDPLLEFVSSVLESAEAVRGFGITYDLRLMRTPGLTALRSLARWAAEPSRQQLFKERCLACVACVQRGLQFLATKAAMAAFFRIAPPTCKTYLTTDLDLASASVACFEPPGAELNETKGKGPSQKDETEGNGPSQKVSHGGTSGSSVVAPPRCSGCFAWYRTGLRGCGVCAGGAWNWPGAVRRRKLEAALQRIDQLEQSNLDLAARLGTLRGRMAKLEAAVPWAAAKPTAKPGLR